MRTVAVVAIVLLLAALAAPAGAKHARTVTQGDLELFDSAPVGYEVILGTTKMVRDEGETEVELEVTTGLIAGTAYVSHVHDEPCDQNEANGHYFFDAPVPDGDGPNGDEIWPEEFTANALGGGEGKTKVGATAGPDAVSVVIHRKFDGKKIACADLK